MSKARVAVLKVNTKELSVTAAALQDGYSRRHLHRLLARYKTGGLDVAIADDTTVTVIELETGEILSTRRIQPERTYWRNTKKPQAEGPGLSSDTCRDSGETCVATHQSGGG